MTWAQFQLEPWGRTEHKAFGSSELAIKPAPEYASSEVLLSGLYRKIGLEGVGEKDVPINGRALLKSASQGKSPASGSIRAEDWSRVLQGTIDSPKLPNQSAKRFLQLTPLVPEAARYSGSARLAGSPWSPGDLVERMVAMGSPSGSEAEALWRALFGALVVTEQDDVWARWLEQEFAKWRAPEATSFTYRPLTCGFPSEFHAFDGLGTQYPARQFVRDLRAVVAAKDLVTRRQWTTLLEAVIRIASVAHVMWLADVNQRTWNVVRSALKPGGALPEPFAYPSAIDYFPYGSPAMDGAKVLVSRYMAARLGLNNLLWALHEIGANYAIALSSSAAIDGLARHARKYRTQLQAAGIDTQLDKLMQSEAKALSCARGAGVNMLEFIRHAAGQRQTARDIFRAYDQGYSVRKRSNDSRSRWVVGLGPVAVMAMAHCCLFETGGARSVHRLCDHLAKYGISIGKDEVASSDLGSKLRLLSLVLDSPDAESGMLVLPPFPSAAAPGLPR